MLANSTEGKLPVYQGTASATRVMMVPCCADTSLTLRAMVRRISSSLFLNRRAATLSRFNAAGVYCRTYSSKCRRSRRSASTSPIADTDAVRGPSSNSDTSPKISPAFDVSSTIFSPLSFFTKISTSPERMMKSACPGSPYTKMLSPGSNFSNSILVASATLSSSLSSRKCSTSLRIDTSMAMRRL